MNYLQLRWVTDALLLVFATGCLVGAIIRVLRGKIVSCPSCQQKNWLSSEQKADYRCCACGCQLNVQYIYSHRPNRHLPMSTVGSYQQFQSSQAINSSHTQEDYPIHQ